MPQGLQCWDGAGRIAVDLSDYAIRYIGSTSVTFAAGETAKTFPFPDNAGRLIYINCIGEFGRSNK
jgi:hypothetical protein